MRKKEAKEVVKRDKQEKRKQNYTPKTKATENGEKIKEKCLVCMQDLDSDAEEDPEKNIGCGNCLKWFHLWCSKFEGLDIIDVKDVEYLCHTCNE